MVDGTRKEIYSHFSVGSAHQEIRVPINNQSIAGYSANNAQIISIVNAYDAKELKSISRELTFDRSWDERSGYGTRQILTVPISYTKYVVGVLQLINKKSEDRFSEEDRDSAVEMLTEHDSIIVQLVNKIITDAHQKNSSDIHIEPYPGKEGADPDVIMVGEMRDHETVSTGIEASLTGHLVFSTLHTNSAPETLVRLLDMGMDPFNFADAFLGVLAQRLVRTFCPSCKEPYHPSPAEYDILAGSYDGDFDALGFSHTGDLVLHRAKGCENCNHSGYKGRAAIIELLEGTHEIRTLIQNKAPVEKIREQAVRDGMTTLMQDGIRKVLLGITDIQQVRMVCIR